MSKGLTLIETIIGVAVISIGVVFIVSVFPLGARIVELNQKSNTALFLASAQIESTVSQEYDDLEKGVFLEDFGEITRFEEYSRETEISCFDPENENCVEDTGMKKVVVTVKPRTSKEAETNLTVIITER